MCRQYFKVVFHTTLHKVLGLGTRETIKDSLPFWSRQTMKSNEKNLYEKTSLFISCLTMVVDNDFNGQCKPNWVKHTKITLEWQHYNFHSEWLCSYNIIYFCILVLNEHDRKWIERKKYKIGWNQISPFTFFFLLYLFISSTSEHNQPQSRFVHLVLCMQPSCLFCCYLVCWWLFFFVLPEQI